MQHKARKRFGQNFLIDNKVIERIISTIAPQDTDNIVEIGPGMGALTQHLLENNKSITAIEIDRDLIKLLKDKYDNSRLNIIQTDVLGFDFKTLGDNIRIIGNLPYNISSPLLFNLIKYKNNINDMLFMLQKEVAERIVASHNSKIYGRLSVMLQVFFDAEIIFTVPKEAFAPQPKIESAIIYLRPKKEQNIVNFDILQKIVKTAFAKRRKILANSLKLLLNQQQTNIDLSKRAEMLSIENFLQLTKDYEKRN